MCRGPWITTSPLNTHLSVLCDTGVQLSRCLQVACAVALPIKSDRRAKDSRDSVTDVLLKDNRVS